jgi:hypothetical protein
MDKNIKDTARFQLDRFLNSKKSYEYDLNPYDIALLNTIVYYIDCDKQGLNICCAKQITIANRSRMSRWKVSKSLKKLNNYELISMQRRWKLYLITVGNNLIMCVPHTRSSVPQLHDQVCSTHTTIEDKKHKIIKKQQQGVVSSLYDDNEEIELTENEITNNVDVFIKSLSENDA